MLKIIFRRSILGSSDLLAASTVAEFSAQTTAFVHGVMPLSLAAATVSRSHSPF